MFHASFHFHSTAVEIQAQVHYFRKLRHFYLDIFECFTRDMQIFQQHFISDKLPFHPQLSFMWDCNIFKLYPFLHNQQLLGRKFVVEIKGKACRSSGKKLV